MPSLPPVLSQSSCAIAVVCRNGLSRASLPGYQFDPNPANLPHPVIAGCEPPSSMMIYMCTWLHIGWLPPPPAQPADQPRPAIALVRCLK